MEANELLSEEKAHQIFDAVAENLSGYRRIPRSTYRIQFNHQFKFSDAKEIIPYLFDLGISDIYASPYFKAARGSLHGYDLLEHNSFNPEVGTDEEYNRFTEELKKHGMGQVLDVVPNHMNISESENPWWMDVLENGPSSPFAEFFDIDWRPVKKELENRILLPILGDQYGRVLEKGELRLFFEEGAFFIRYHERRLPVAPVSYGKILRYRMDEMKEKMGTDHPHLQELLSILTALIHLPPQTERDPERIVERRREKEIIKRRLWTLYQESEEIHAFIDGNVEALNGAPDDPRSFDLLDDLLNQQIYRLAHWRVATEEINYRRFFDINELAAIRMENPEVFKAAHRLVFHLVRKGQVTGLRVDHPDGLYNPSEYLYRLQKACFIQYCLRAVPDHPDAVRFEEKIGRLYEEELSRNPSSPVRMPLYIVGEKILIKSERIPEDWPIESTTGYGYSNSMNGIFIDADHAKAFDDLYVRFTRERVNYSGLVYEKKKLIMQTSMPGEVNMLAHALNRISERSRNTRDFTLNSLAAAIVEVIAFFPVYRTYATSCGVVERDRRYIEQAVSRAKRKNPSLSATVFDFLKEVLLLRFPDHLSEPEKKEWIDFVMRFQQITGPVMAKGVEDTAFYVYNRFVSLNEVGGNPERFGTPLETFHGQNIERAKTRPNAMITTMTHDSKRGEDVKSRLNVLSELPGELRECLVRWSRSNRRKKSVLDGDAIPDRNEEYLLYQTLLGTWPVAPINRAEQDRFRERIEAYMLKAVREAKVNTSWINPNHSYEEHLLKFIAAVLSTDPSNHFIRDFESFQRKLSFYGMLNSLSQTLLKITCPGIPDFFQGRELWDFTLVDPDNRGPVDYLLGKAILDELKGRISNSPADLKDLARELLEEWKDGSVKLFLTYRALNFRKEHAQLFPGGNYIPLPGEGKVDKHLCAFARQHAEQAVLVLVPRFLTGLVALEEMPLGSKVWGDSAVPLPEEIGGDQFRDAFTGGIVRPKQRNGGRVLFLGEVFDHFSAALLEKV
jgi:(1->4)-alpha-D-glucan 1-alpha-D-glucosylmutase